MHFSCEELEKRFLRTLNEEQAQGDAFATFLMLCCCAINWFILSGPYGHFLPQPLHMVILSSLAVISLAVQLMITVPKLSVVYKHNRTLIMGIVRVNCTAVTTLTYGPTHGQHPTITTALSTTRMPAYHCYLESKIPNDTTLLHLVHYVADGMPIVPAFVALVFPLPFHAHIALLLTSHAHLILSQWYDCIRLVAYPVTGAAYRTGTLDIMANPDAATEAVQVCRHISIVGQVAMLAVFAVYSWRQEYAHRWRFLKAAFDCNVAHGGDAQQVATTELRPIGPLCRWGHLALLEIAVLCPLCWATLYSMRSEHHLAVR